MPAKLGIYLHFPHCVRRCPYCDFYSSEAPWDARAWLSDALAGLRRFYDGRPAESIYFGGGTPSLLPPAVIAEFLAAAPQAPGDYLGGQPRHRVPRAAGGVPPGRDYTNFPWPAIA
ncbi:hypothetical protein FACS1894186_3060 [Alphaproteobacteria bacterium]|nr:hypothetical protein FACS1894186_3060 [Alphaproteobacteria bacterium]